MMNPLNSLFSPLGLIGIVLALACAVHVVRTGRPLYWIFIILLFPGLGPLIYFIAEWLPELTSGRAANKFRKTAQATLDPDRAYREAKQALEITPSVQNRKVLGDLCLQSGRYSEAEQLFREALQGLYAEDPPLLLGHARALLELGQPEEALARLEAIRKQGDREMTPPTHLALARAYEALGRFPEAAAQYEWSAPRVAGFEAQARYIAFLAARGRKDEARAQLEDLDRRAGRTNSAFREEALHWRDFAARGLAA